MPGIADHAIVMGSLDFSFSISEYLQSRQVWEYNKADWIGFKRLLNQYKWRWIDETNPDDAAKTFTDTLLKLAKQFIPRKTVYVSNGSHPWINQMCLDLINSKQQAWGTPSYHEKAKICSKGLFDEYLAYVRRMKNELSKLKRGSKQWWSLSKRLINKAGKSVEIPFLKKADGS